MTQYEIEQEIIKQEANLEIAEGCDEEVACLLFNVDCKAEAIALINEELDFYRSLLKPTVNFDDEMDYINLQLSQGMAATYW